MLVVARSNSKVPVPNVSADWSAATKMFATSDPNSVSSAAIVGNRQSTPRPARRIASPIRQPRISVAQGNTRFVSADSAAQPALKANITTKPATIALRSDWTAISRSPSAAVPCVFDPTPCFFLSRSGL